MMPIGEWIFWLWAIVGGLLAIQALTVLLTGRAIERRLAAILTHLERLDGRDE